MPTPYKGTMIPIPTDLADGPKAFQDYTDSLVTADAVKGVDVPAGTVMFTCRTTQPTGWLFLDGSTVVGGQTLYPNLWAVVPVAWRVGADIKLPDARGRFVVALNPTDTTIDAIGEAAGSKIIVANNLPVHTHPAGTLVNANNTHSHQPSKAANNFVTNAAGLNVNGGLQLAAGGEQLAATDSYTHTHDITGATGNNTTTATAFMPPYITFNVMMRAS